MHCVCFYAIQPEEMNARIIGRRPNGSWIVGTFKERLEAEEKEKTEKFEKKNPDVSAEQRKAETAKIHAKALKTVFSDTCETIVHRNMQGVHCDWCEVNGRWFPYLLIKKDVAEYSMGRHYNKALPDRLRDAPKGYKFAAAARKKDIDFDMIRRYREGLLKEAYDTAKTAFETGDLTKAEKRESTGLEIKDNALVYPSGKALYLAGESFEEFLDRHGMKIVKYPFTDISGAADSRGMIGEVSFFSNFAGKDRENAFTDFYDCEVSFDWDHALSDFIDNLPDDAVLAVVDCHV